MGRGALREGDLRAVSRFEKRPFDGHVTRSLFFFCSHGDERQGGTGAETLQGGLKSTGPIGLTVGQARMRREGEERVTVRWGVPSRYSRREFPPKLKMGGGEMSCLI